MARTKVTIVGLGDRMQGVGKRTGKPYDFQRVSFVYSDRFTNGVKAVTANVEGDMIDAIGGLCLNDEREIFFHTINGSVVVDGIL